MKCFYMNRIRFHLGFQAKAVSWLINMSVFSFFIFNKIACIKLYARTIRKSFQYNSGFFGTCAGDLTDLCLCIPVSHIIMVVSSGNFKLFKICFDVPANFFLFSEIHRSSLYGNIFSKGNRTLAYRGKFLSMNG